MDFHSAEEWKFENFVSHTTRSHDLDGQIDASHNRYLCLHANRLCNTRSAFTLDRSESKKTAILSTTCMASSPKLQGGRKDSLGDHVRFGVVTVSDRASTGVYDDLSGPAMLQFLSEAVDSR